MRDKLVGGSCLPYSTQPSVHVRMTFSSSSRRSRTPFTHAASGPLHETPTRGRLVRNEGVGLRQVLIEAEHLMHNRGQVASSSCAELSALLRQLRRQLEVSGAVPEERKLISVLFVDLVGFTTRSDGADPEDVRDALQLYHADAKERIEHDGGTLEKFIEDAVMAVFGAPVARRRRGTCDLSARAAVNTGEAVVSMASDRGEALAMGDVVNTASRDPSCHPLRELAGDRGQGERRARRRVARG
jgi:hypothetical protein